MQNNAIYWLAALRLPDVSSVKFRRWLNSFENIEMLFSANDRTLQQAGLKPKDIHVLKNPDWKSAEADFLWCEKNNCHLVTGEDEKYPVLLRETYGAPLLLFVRGDVDLLSQPQIAMVGSRNPTQSGSETAARFAGCFTKSGLIVTSGLALGIDAASHRGALKAGGKTLAVLGTGLKTIYPASHRKLAEEIAANGALISEFLPDVAPIAKNFPQRNQIISGLSLGVVVVEAALKSDTDYGVMQLNKAVMCLRCQGQYIIHWHAVAII